MFPTVAESIIYPEWKRCGSFPRLRAVASKFDIHLMTSTLIQRLRARSQRIYRLLRGHYWFPQVPLALLLGLGGLWLLRASFG